MFLGVLGKEFALTLRHTKFQWSRLTIFSGTSICPRSYPLTRIPLMEKYPMGNPRGLRQDW